MANRHSSGCSTSLNSLSNTIKEAFRSTLTAPIVNNRIGTLRDNEELKSAAQNVLVEQGSDTNWENLAVELNSIFGSAEYKTLSGEERVLKLKEERPDLHTFLNKLVSHMDATFADARGKDALKENLHKAGVSTSPVRVVIDSFEREVPYAYRNDVVTQVLSLALQYLQVLKDPSEYPEYAGMDNKEILEAVGPDEFFSALYDYLFEDYDRNLSDVEKWEEQTIDDVEKRKERKEVREALVQKLRDANNDTWKAVVYLTKRALGSTLGIKMGTKFNFVSYAEEEPEYDKDGSERYVGEESLEHWMLVTDTISAYHSLAVETRALLSQVMSNSRGILGFFSIADQMALYDKLMSLRYANVCQNSDEFMDALEDEASNPKSKWRSQARQILDLINDDTTGALKTTVFNNFRKNAQYYFDHNYYKTSDGKVYVYRNSSRTTWKKILGKYTQRILTKVLDTNLCIYDSTGSIIRNKLTEFHNYLHAPYSKQGDILNTEMFFGIHRVPMSLVDDSNRRRFEALFDKLNEEWVSTNADEITKERQLDDEFINQDFIQEAALEAVNNIDKRLNLFLTEEKKQDILSSRSNFGDFIDKCSDIERELYSKLAVGAAARANQNNSRITELLKSKKNSSLKKAFGTLLNEVADYEESVEVESPVERMYRHLDSNYMASIQPTNIGNMFERIRSAYRTKGVKGLRSYLEEHYLNCPIFATKLGDGIYDIHHRWLAALYNATNKDFTNKKSFVYQLLDGIERGLGNSEKEFSQFSFIENAKFTMAEWFLALEKSKGTIGKVPLFVTGDSNATRYLPTVVRSFASDVEPFIDLAISELERMIMSEDLVTYFEKDGKTYEGAIKSNMHTWQYLPFLQDEKINGENLLQHYKNIYAADFRGDRNAALTAFRDTLRPIIEDNLNLQFKEFCKALEARDLLIASGTQYILNTKMLSIPVSENKPELEIGHEMLRDYYFNQMLGMAEQLQFTTIDPSFYKDVADMQKRYKEVISSGTTLDFTAVDTEDGRTFLETMGKNGTITQKVVYFEDIKLSVSNPELLAAIKELGYEDKYKANTLTDGQAYRSFESYRAICKMLGGNNWSASHEAVYKIIMSHRENNPNTPLSDSEWRQIDSYNVTFQPLKCFGFYHENPGVSAKYTPIPVQHKYSEFPVIPELLPKVAVGENQVAATKLETLGKFMRDNKVDLVCASSCVKVGLYGDVSIANKDAEGNTSLVNDANGNKTLTSTLQTAKVHELDLSGYVQQSNVPEHLGGSRVFGSQERVHGDGLGNSRSTNYKGSMFSKLGRTTVKITSNEEIDTSRSKPSNNDAIKFFHSLLSSGFIRSVRSLMSGLSDTKKLSDTLVELKSNDSRADFDTLTQHTLNSETGDFELPFSEPMNEFDNTSSLFSLFRKRVIKQQVKGGSAVQVSAYGFEDVLGIKVEKTADGKHNVVAADCAMAFDFSYVDSQGKEVSLNYFDYVDANTGMLLGYNDKGDLVPVEPKEPVPNDIDKQYYGWNTKLGQEFPGALDIIAYRIPTEKLYSSLNLRVKRFFHKSNGGIIMVPTEFTTVAGFDFDIDKLYFIKRNYHHERMTKERTEEFISQVWKDIYNLDAAPKERSEVYKELVAARDRVNSQKEGANKVVASSGFNSTTMGDIVGEKLLASLSEEERSEFLAMQEAETGSNEAKGETNEAADSNVTKEIKEYLRLYQYWEEAGLTEKLGKTATEYFEDFVTSRKDQYNKIFLAKLTKYDSSKTPLQNHQHDCDNVVFDYFQDLLSSPDTFKERFTPGGFANFKAAKALMLALRYAPKSDLEAIRYSSNPEEELRRLATKYGEDFKFPYRVLDPLTVSHFQTQNALYDRLIGLAANHSLNTRYTANTRRFELERPIIWGGMLDRVNTDNAVGKDLKKRYLGGIDSELIVTETLSASVDAVKDALLEFFGIDDNSFNLACFAARIGATPEDIGLLLNLPIVQEAIEMCKNSNGKSSFISAVKQTARRRILDNHFDEALTEVNREAKEEMPTVDTNTLIRLCTYKVNELGNLDTTTIKDFAKCVYLLSTLSEKASVVNDQVATSKNTSVKTIKSSNGEAELLQQKTKFVEAELASPESGFIIDIDGDGSTTIVDPGEDLTDLLLKDPEAFLERVISNPYCIQQVCFTAFDAFTKEVMSRLVPYYTGAYKDIKSVLAGYTRKDYLSGDINNAINADFTAFVVERMFSSFDSNRKVDWFGKNLNISAWVFYKAVFPVLYKNIKAKLSKTFPELRENPVISLYEEREGVIMFDEIGSLQKEQKAMLKEGFNQLLESNNEAIREFGKHLLYYSIINYKFTYGKRTFYPLLSNKAKKALVDIDGVTRYADIWNRMFNLQLRSNSDGTLNIYEAGGNFGNDRVISGVEWMKMFMLNHPEFYHFSTTITGKNAKALAGDDPAKRNGSFTVNPTSEEHKNIPIFEKLVDPSGNVIGYRFIPVLIIDGVSYLCGYDVDSVDFNTSTSSTPQITYRAMCVDAGLRGLNYSDLLPWDTHSSPIQIEAFSELKDGDVLGESLIKEATTAIEKLKTNSSTTQSTESPQTAPQQKLTTQPSAQQTSVVQPTTEAPVTSTEPNNGEAIGSGGFVQTSIASDVKQSLDRTYKRLLTAIKLSSAKAAQRKRMIQIVQDAFSNFEIQTTAAKNSPESLVRYYDEYLDPIMDFEWKREGVNINLFGQDYNIAKIRSYLRGTTNQVSFVNDFEDQVEEGKNNCNENLCD